MTFNSFVIKLNVILLVFSFKLIKNAPMKYLYHHYLCLLNQLVPFKCVYTFCCDISCIAGNSNATA